MKTCMFKGCEEKEYARGLCVEHYRACFKGKNFKEARSVYGYPDHYLMKQNRLIRFSQVNYKCELCGTKAKYIHHKDLAKDNHAIENLQALCVKCHNSIHKGRPRKYPQEWYDTAKKIGVSFSTYKRYKEDPQSVSVRIRHAIEVLGINVLKM